MQFFAHIKEGSPIDKAWRRGGLKSGRVGRARFEYDSNRNLFVAPSTLEADVIAELRNNSSVVLEVITGAMPQL